MKTYREAYKLYMCSGILFNHESEVRGPEFVTRKITMHVARYAIGDHTPLELCNLDARKDWGYARDYVEGMMRTLHYRYAEDFVMGTGELHTVRDFVEEAFKNIDVKINWKGSGVNEVGLSDKDEVVVRVNKRFFRPLESDNYIADYSKAKKGLGWEPKVKFAQLVKIMVKSDLKNLESK